LIRHISARLTGNGKNKEGEFVEHAQAVLGFFQFLEWTPKLIADQITKLQHDAFCAIKIGELSSFPFVQNEMIGYLSSYSYFVMIVFIIIYSYYLFLQSY